MSGGSSRSGAKRLLQDGEPLVQLVRRDLERGQQADDVAVQAAGEEDRGRARTPRRRPPVARSGVRSANSNASIEPRPRTSPMSGLRAAMSLEARAQRLAELACAARGTPARSRCRGRRAPRRTRAGCRRTCRRARRAGRRPSPRRRPVTPASGSPPPIDFPKTVMSGSTPAYCSIAHIVPVRPTPDCTSSFDVEDPVRAAELLQPRRIVRRHRDEAALALHRLEDDAGDRRRVDVRLEEMLERRDRSRRRRCRGTGTAPARGRPRARTGRSPALYGFTLLVIVIASSVRPWNALSNDDHRGAAGRRARDLHRVLDRLGARVDEDRALLAAAARRELGEPPADLDVRLVDADHEALVEVAVGLLLDRLDDRRRCRWPGVLAADPAGEVDERAAVDVR